jgi:8-amino-7-oxononanoate synthase
MGAFEDELWKRLKRLEKENLRRQLRRVSSAQAPNAIIEGRAVLNFSSNDYLGLATHPMLREAGEKALWDFGSGSGASRLICGSLAPHEELEDALAEFKGAEAALVFSSGYAAALGTIPPLVGSGDVVVVDKLVHASIVDAARLSGAKLRIFAHNDLNELEEILRWCEGQGSGDTHGRVLIVTETIFSMDGDFALLPEIVALKEKHGAWLMVDEAHATGLFGECRRGLIEMFDLSGRVEIQMGTLGKALGTAGGFITGSRALREYLINKARSFIFSTAPPPAVSASAKAAVEMVRSGEGAELLKQLRCRLRQFHDCSRIVPAGKDSPIVPHVIGAEAEALAVAARLWERGIFVPAIRYPTVARGKARLRFTFSAAHKEEEIAKLAATLHELGQVR